MDKVRSVVVLLAFHFAFSLGASSGEISALTDLYYACDGDAWVNNTNWLHGDPCTGGWYGVVCESSHVSGLYLQSNHLDGKITDTLDNLYALDTLALYDNDISGSIPSAWSYLRSLVKLDIHDNKFSGPIPEALGSLLEYNLAYLDLSDNLLGGSVPSFFNGAQNEFSYVDLSGNQFICPVPNWAQYTHADCLECGLESVQPYCTALFEPVILFGYNFNALSAANCSMINPATGVLVATTPARILSDSMIQCQVYWPFANCSGAIGDRLYEMVNLHLSLNGQIITNGSSVELGVLNPYCVSGSTTGWKIPSESTVQAMCTVSGNPTPWQCPAIITGSSSLPNAKFEPDCTNNSTMNCEWTLSPSSYHTCQYYQCYRSSSPHCNSMSSYSTCTPSSSNYGGSCYSSLDACTANCH